MSKPIKTKLYNKSGDNTDKKNQFSNLLQNYKLFLCFFVFFVKVRMRESEKKHGKVNLD